ncbi:MAG: hypothetical protein OEZ34_15250 [Spirochaetia bacterium]|nr:hypothetical protein [Spirochaetia bacterium]
MIQEEIEKYLALRKSGLFESIDFSFLTEISKLFSGRRSGPGEIIFDPDRDRASVYILKEGEIVDESGNAFRTISGLKDILFLQFDHKNYNRRLYSGKDGCFLYAADGRSFLDLLQEIPELSRQMLSLEEG